MKAHELFGVVVRTLGVWVLIQAALSIVLVGSASGVVALAMEVALGLYLFFKADQVVSAAYQRLPPSDFDPLIAD